MTREDFLKQLTDLSKGLSHISPERIEAMLDQVLEEHGAELYECGYECGYDEGRSSGYDTGKDDGWDLGYEAGYEAGQEDAE